jgi:hemin uptake protein HemP
MKHITPSPNHLRADTPLKTSASTSAQPPAWPSSTLLQGHKAIAINHNGMLYTLQCTKMGKLILTK